MGALASILGFLYVEILQWYVSTMNHPFNQLLSQLLPIYIHKLIKEIPRPNAIMARLGSIFSHDSLYLLHMLVLLLLLLLLQACPQIAFSHSMVKFLPGFQGPLPFELETGLVHML